VGIGGIAVVAAIAPTLVESLVALAQGGPWRAARGVAPVTIIASFIPLFTVTIGVSLAAAVAAERADLTAQLARQRSEAARAAARVQAVLGHEQRRLARSLHADLQATINAAGMMLERADRAGGATPEHFDEVAARIATSVKRLLEEGASTLPLVARLAEVRALWAGVCAVGLELDAAATARIDADPVTRELLVDLVTEACANAVVHGDAARIDVRIGLVEDEVELDISDDGTRRAPAGDAGAGAGAGDGLGTEVLRMSCTSFSVDVGAHGTRLHAMVPLG
jgi:signal transduction histidine kinase